MTARNALLLGVFVLGVVGAGITTEARSLQAPRPAGTAVDRGHATFKEECAVCHGDQGKGTASTSPDHPAPPDLTILARKANGLFPAAHVEAVLKGTDPVAAHTPAMKGWLALFVAQADGSMAAADARVADLVQYLGSIQVK